MIKAVIFDFQGQIEFLARFQPVIDFARPLSNHADQRAIVKSLSPRIDTQFDQPWREPGQMARVPVFIRIDPQPAVGSDRQENLPDHVEVGDVAPADLKIYDFVSGRAELARVVGGLLGSLALGSSAASILGGRDAAQGFTLGASLGALRRAGRGRPSPSPAASSTTSRSHRTAITS